MKIIKPLIIGMLVAVLLPLGACKSKKDVLVEIDDDVITKDQFLNYYYTQNRILLDLPNEEIEKLSNDPEMAQAIPTLNKRLFMEQLIALKLMKNKLEESKKDTNEFDTIMELMQLQAYSMYFVTKKMKDKIQISNDEIGKYYYSHPEISNRLPLNKIVETQIKQQLLQDKAKEQGIGPQTFVGDLVAEAKVKKENFDNWLNELDKQKQATEPAPKPATVKKK